jgi:hypothetical protein
LVGGSLIIVYNCIYTLLNVNTYHGGVRILPATIHNGELKFLFGKELDSDSMPGFSDFGGG